MSTVEGPPEHAEIIIIRRGGGDHEEGHHGGAWKIAYADFVTAMMCFFLVMWLINAANEETKAAVASYFNPVKLTDRNSSKKSLSDQGNGPNQAGTISEDDAAPQPQTKTAPTTGNAEHNQTSNPVKESTTYSDENLFSDPYAVLAEIAAETGQMQNTSERGEGGAQDAGPATGASGGESYRDPFSPDFWSKQIAQPQDSGDFPRAGDASQSAETGSAGTSGQTTAELTETFPASAPAPEAKPLPELPKLAEPANEAAIEQKPEAGPAEKSEAEAIKSELDRALAADPKLLDGMTVVAEQGGVRISVTEKQNYPMFEVGSAVPRGDLVRGMEKIAKVVSDHPGTVSIEGHTDARPFKGAKYDNWRLSTARAHSAYYMLVRAGLDEQRIREVAGFADRDLKDAANPRADVNRRIEIFIRTAE